jgi:predicted methyltransferase
MTRLTLAVRLLTVCGAALAAAPEVSAAELTPSDLNKLDAVLADPRRDADRERDRFRHPMETLVFFGIEPDMLVVEAMAGEGWYARILLPYLTPDGGYAAVNYSVAMTELMSNGRLTDAGRRVSASWPERYLAEAGGYGPSGAPIEAVFLYGSIPETVRGRADAVLYVRALHHLARTGELHNALVDTYDMLKPGGIVGVVQHATQPSTPVDYDLSGAMGYLSEAYVIDAFEDVGFVFEASSDLNRNLLDHADHAGGSWSMPPTGRSAATAGLGETNRMTLRFRKPAD